MVIDNKGPLVGYAFYELLEAENARLKEEVKRLEAVIESYKDSGIRIFAMMDEERRNTSHLKAEVERLTERNKFLEQIDSYLQGANENTYEKRCDELEAEVERLGKAGDAMQKRLIFLHDRWDSDEPNIESEAWNAAKEGKQP